MRAVFISSSSCQSFFAEKLDPHRRIRQVITRYIFLVTAASSVCAVAQGATVTHAEGHLCFAAALVCLGLPPTTARGERRAVPSGRAFSRSAFSRCHAATCGSRTAAPVISTRSWTAIELALTACLGTPVCPAEPIERVRVRVRGKPSNPSPREIAGELLDAFAGLSGAEPLYNGVDLSGAGPTPEICAQARVQISTATRNDHDVSLRVTARSAVARLRRAWPARRTTPVLVPSPASRRAACGVRSRLMSRARRRQASVVTCSTTSDDLVLRRSDHHHEATARRSQPRRRAPLPGTARRRAPPDHHAVVHDAATERPYVLHLPGGDGDNPGVARRTVRAGR
jgi:hypothetical protein